MDPANVNLSIRRGVTFRGFTLTCKDSSGNPVPLAGWSAFAQIRSQKDDSLIWDLAPTIASNDAAGLITVPPIPFATTLTLPPGDYVFDLLPQDPTGIRYDPIIQGNVKITTATTRPV